jgi:hypothetical protein
MLFFQETYGEDADGNRGHKTWVCEFENTNEEKEEIADCLYEDFIGGETEGEFVIMLCNPYTQEDMGVEVNIEDYLDLLIVKAKDDQDLKDDAEFQEWLAGIGK